MCAAFDEGMDNRTVGGFYWGRYRGERAGGVDNRTVETPVGLRGWICEDKEWERDGASRK